MKENAFANLRNYDARWIPVNVRDFTPDEYGMYYSGKIVQSLYMKAIEYNSMLHLGIMYGSELENLPEGAIVKTEDLAVFTLRKYVRDANNSWDNPVLCEDAGPSYRVAYSDEVDWDNITLL